MQRSRLVGSVVRSLASLLLLGAVLVGGCGGDGHPADGQLGSSCGQATEPACAVGLECDQGTCRPQHCGGNVMHPATCPDGFECVPEPDQRLPFGDVGGICAAKKS